MKAGTADISPVSLFDAAVFDIDETFNVSTHLKEHFLTSFQNAAKQTVLVHSQQQVLSNAQLSLKGIAESSIKEAEKNILGILYRQGVISVVSAAEQILKASFNDLLDANLEEIDKKDKFEIDFDELKIIGFKTDREYWVEKITNELYGGKNPQEKLNFQNVKATENLLKSYFKIDLAQFEKYESVAREVHYFYQVRHILLHNGGYIDQRFIDNLSAAGISTSELSKNLGKKLLVQEKQYRLSKDCFFSFFAMLEGAIQFRGLRVVES